VESKLKIKFTEIEKIYKIMFVSLLLMLIKEKFE